MSEQLENLIKRVEDIDYKCRESFKAIERRSRDDIDSINKRIDDLSKRFEQSFKSANNLCDKRAYEINVLLEDHNHVFTRMKGIEQDISEIYKKTQLLIINNKDFTSLESLKCLIENLISLKDKDGKISTKLPKEFDPDKIFMKIDDLELTVRSSNCLKSANLYFVGDIVCNKESDFSDLRKIRNYRRFKSARVQKYYISFKL